MTTDPMMIQRFSDFRWCIDNDFQVYIMPLWFSPDGVGSSKCKIHIRRNGITTEGKDFIIKNGIEIHSKVTELHTEYKNMNDASEACWEVYAALRKRYGKSD